VFPLKETVQKHHYAHALATFGGTALDKAKALNKAKP